MNNKQVIKEWFANIDAKNFDGIKKLMDKKHAFHNPLSPAPAGVDEHLGMIQMLTNALPGNHHVDLTINDGEYITVRGHWSGKHTGDFNGVPATGKPVRFTWTDIFHIEKGKVTDEYLEMNPMAIMSQIGN